MVMHRISRVEISAGADADGLKIWNIHSWSKKSGKAETWRIAVMNKTDKIYVAGHRGLVGSAGQRIYEYHRQDAQGARLNQPAGGAGVL